MEPLSRNSLMKYLRLLTAEVEKMVLNELPEKFGTYSSQVPSRSGYTSQNQNQESTATPWACLHCTFHNISGSSCEMCGLPRD